MVFFAGQTDRNSGRYECLKFGPHTTNIAHTNANGDAHVLRQVRQRILVILEEV
jgi:hypothetical protein